MATARRLIFFFRKASIADLVTLLFTSLQNSEGGGGGCGDSNSGNSCADPSCQFYHFRILTLSPMALGPIGPRVFKGIQLKA